MPNVAYVKAIDYHLYVSLLLIFLSLLEYAFVLNIKLKRKANIKRCSKRDDIEMQSRYSCNSELNNTDVSEPPDTHSFKNKSSLRHWKSFELEFITDNVHIVDRISRILFPLLYTLFAVVYWAFWLAG